MKEFKSRNSPGIAAVVAGLAVLVVILGAALAYVLVAPPSMAPSSATTSTAVVTSTVTASGTGSGAVTTTVTSATTVGGQQDLEAAAKAEGGTITVYTIQDPTTYNTYFGPNLMKSYPWLKINAVFLDPAGTISRPTSEFQAGKVQTDIIEAGSLSRMLTDVKNGVCATVDLSSYLANLGYPSTAYNNTNGQYYTRWVTPYVMFYNTQLVSPSQVPKSYTDLANPQWKGKLALDNPVGGSAASTIMASLYATMGNASWTQFMKNLAANKPAMQASGGTVETLVTQGQYAIGVDTLNGVLNSVNKSLPVKVAWTNTVFSQPSAFCIAKNGPHPNTALLYAQWELSTHGQLLLTRGNASPSLNPVFAPYALPGVLPSNSTISGIAAQTDLYSNPNKWNAIWTSFFGTG